MVSLLQKIVILKTLIELLNVFETIVNLILDHFFKSLFGHFSQIKISHFVKNRRTKVRQFNVTATMLWENPNMRQPL